MSRRFELVEDIKARGRRVLAEGIEFSDGAVVVRWVGAIHSIALWPSIAEVHAAHAHGRTEITWLDPHATTTDTCTLPPYGWWCSREAGHPGPCAARARAES